MNIHELRYQQYEEYLHLKAVNMSTDIGNLALGVAFMGQFETPPPQVETHQSLHAAAETLGSAALIDNVFIYPSDHPSPGDLARRSIELELDKAA